MVLGLLLLAVAMQVQAQVPDAEAAAVCKSGNLLRRGVLTGQGTKGALTRLRSQLLRQEGSQWDGAGTVRLDDKQSWVQVDLGAAYPLSHLVVQADNNDVFAVEGSLDGKRYERIWSAGPMEGAGLRTRYGVLSKPATARFLRVSGRGGDGHYSVSAIRAYCEAPQPWPPELRLPPVKRYWEMLTKPLMVHVQAAVGAAALVLLLFAYFFRYGFRVLPPQRVRDGALLLAGLGALWAAAHTALWYWAAVAGGLLLAWYLLRWASGDTSAPRAIAPLAQACCRRPLALVLSGLGLLAVAWVIYEWGWVRGAGLALLGIGLGGTLRMMREPVSFRQSARIWLLWFGLFGLGSFWNFGHFHFNHFIHTWEQYHYVLGAKYGPELRYARLYDCTSAADVADGLTSRVQERKVRRLATDNLLGDTTEIIANPGICTDHFSDERWAQFRKDLRFFRGRFSKERWNKSQTDHGYNATPVWGILARLVIDRVGDLNWDKIEYLGSIDVVLLLLAWLAAAGAFGFEPVCVALVYWGLNYPARYYWNGGSFLRYGWLFWLVIGLCLLRKKRMAGAGFALTYATSLRIFPGFVVATLMLKALYGMWVERRWVVSAAHKRFAAGCIIGLGLLIPASAWSMGGLDAWPEFVQNSQKHLNTALTNNMGFKTVIAYDFDTRAVKLRDSDAVDPYGAWKAARADLYEQRKPLFFALLIGFAVLLARAAHRVEDWEAACLGVGLIVMATELTCYYYGFLLAYGLMWERRKLPGVLAVAFAVLTLWLDQLPWNDDRYTAMSLAAVLMVWTVTGLVAFGRQRGAEAANAPERLGHATSPGSGAGEIGAEKTQVASTGAAKPGSLEPSPGTSA